MPCQFRRVNGPDIEVEDGSSPELFPEESSGFVRSIPAATGLAGLDELLPGTPTEVQVVEVVGVAERAGEGAQLRPRRADLVGAELGCSRQDGEGHLKG